MLQVCTHEYYLFARFNVLSSRVHRLNEICKLHLAIEGKAHPASLACNLNSSFAEIRRERVPKIFDENVSLC